MTASSRPGVGRFALAAAIFVQMLPATLLAPAVRPLFAAQHAGREGAMHAFMALNMVGAVIAAPLIGRSLRRGVAPAPLLVALALVDAVLLAAIALLSSTPLVLALRFVEGAAHVGAATVLIAEAAQRHRSHGERTMMPLAGAALMLAVAAGSALGGQLVAWHVRAPYLTGAGVLVLVAAAVPRLGLSRVHDAAVEAPSMRLSALAARLWIPLGAAFFGRFTVGCIVVTFALFARAAHHIDDRDVGFLYTTLTLPFALLMYPAGRLADRTSRALTLATGAALYATALLALGFAPAVLLPLLMLVAGTGSALVLAPTLLYAATLGPGEERARAMALVNGASCLGMIVGPAAAGIVSAALRTPADPLRGYRGAFLLAGSSLLVWLLAATPWLVARSRQELGDDGEGAIPSASKAR